MSRVDEYVNLFLKCHRQNWLCDSADRDIAKALEAAIDERAEFLCKAKNVQIISLKVMLGKLEQRVGCLEKRKPTKVCRACGGIGCDY